MQSELKRILISCFTSVSESDLADLILRLNEITRRMNSQEDSHENSHYFKRPSDVSTSSASARTSNVSVVESVYAKSAFFKKPSASTVVVTPDRTSSANQSSQNYSDDRTLAGNKSSPYSSSASLASASYTSSTTSLSDFKVNRRKGRNSFDTSSVRERGANTTIANNSSLYGEDHYLRFF